MKLSILLKKLAVPVMALAMVGMLAACSTSSGGGSSSGDDTKKTNGGNGSSGDLSSMFPDPTGDYFVKWDNVILVQCEEEEFTKMGEKFGSGDGTLDGKTFKLTDKGLDTFIELVAKEADEEHVVKNPVSVFIYKNYPLFAADGMELEAFKKRLTVNTDYEEYKSGKIIVLTEAGLLKMMMSGNQ